MKFIIFLLIFISCLNQKSTHDENLETLLRRLSFSKEVFKINPNISQGVLISSPPDTWQLISKFKLKVTSETYLVDCLFYKVPTAKNAGILKLVSEKNGKSCDESYLEKGKIEVNKINKLSYLFKENILHLKLNDQNFKIKMPNIWEKTVKPKVFSSDIKNDVSLLGFGLLDYVPSEVYGEEILKENDYCHTYTNSCSEKIAYKCDKCPQGIFTEVVSSNCRDGYNKICGDFSCGGVGELACIRGFQASKFKLDYCINDSPVGFCDEGLRVYCRDDKLVCAY